MMEVTAPDPPPARRRRRAKRKTTAVMDGPYSEAKELAIAHWSAARAKASAGRFASVHGLRMYYEVHGRGRPLVLLHGGFTTIESSFGEMVSDLARTRRVIAIEQQAHGRTEDIDRPLSYAQMAEDTAELLRQLDVRQADFLGYSMGGSIALQLAVRHPGLARKLAVVSSAYDRDAYEPGLWTSIRAWQPTDEGAVAEARRAFQSVAPRPELWPRSMSRMKEGVMSALGLRAEHLRAIRAQALVISEDDRMVLAPEHAHELARLMPHAQYELVTNADHQTVIKRAAPRLPAFFDAPLPRAM